MSKLMLLPAIGAALCLLGCSPVAPDANAERDLFKPEAVGEAKALSLKALDIDPDAFVEGNLYFLLYHEMAHALISEFDLPVAGREEDAADRLATLMMTPEDKDEDPSYLVGAMRGWFLTADETPLAEIEWWDEHGTDQQRGYQIACLLFGADPQRFQDVADAAELPEERRETCEEESIANQNSWATLLDSIPSGETVPDRNAVTVNYQPTTDYAAELSYVQELRLLEDIAEILALEYGVKPGITVMATECDEANAYWFPADRTLTLCYELVAEYQAIAEQGQSAE